MKYMRLCNKCKHINDFETDQTQIMFDPNEYMRYYVCDNCGQPIVIEKGEMK